MKMKEQKITDIRNELDTILSNLKTQSEKGLKLHEVERGLFSSLLRLGFHLLSYYILLVQECMVIEGKVLGNREGRLRNKGYGKRSYRSLFGQLSIVRQKYYDSSAHQTHYPLDAALGLPKSNYSYVLDDWLAYGAVEMDFAQSVGLLNRILGQDLSAMQSSRRSYALSAEVDPYYESQRCETVDDCSHLSVGFDGKGVPILRSETDRALESVATRLGKGAKRGVKKEATVSVSSSFSPKTRSPEELICSLFKTAPADKVPKTKAHTWHEHKHIRAFLSDKPRAIQYGIEQVLKRDPTGNKPIIVLIDGDRALEQAVRASVSEKQIAHRVDAYILDFIHLLEYVWKVANAHLGEKHPDRESWVEKQARMLLNSQSEKVLEQWNQLLKQGHRSTTQQKNLQAAITYLSNRPHMVDYKTYLEKGYPITTGAVESACGHFVKSRMERNAMHWGKIGAQMMLNIRAVKKNHDWDQYVDHFIQKEQHLLYPCAA